MLASRFAVAAVILGVAAVLYAAAAASHPAAAAPSRQAPAAEVAVSTAQRACPAPGLTGNAGGGLAIASAPAGSATTQPATTRSASTQSGAGQPGAAAASSVISARAIVTSLAPGGGTVATLTVAGRLATPAVPVARGPAAQAHDVGTVPTMTSDGGVAVAAAGALAQGLAVEQTSPSGLPTALCAAPGTSFWFAGPGAAAAADISLYLVNPGGQAADVEVTASTDDGPQLGSTDSGISVPPHAVLVQSLNRLLGASSRAMALHVSASSGQIVAAVREATRATAPGVWLPPLQAPSRRVVVPGLPDSAGTRELYVEAPGAGNAQVKLTAITPKGTYQPTGGTDLELPGQTATPLPLSSLASTPAGLEVTANVPVVAGLMVPGGPAGAPGAAAGSAAPVAGRSVLIARGGRPSLILSAPRNAVTATIATATAAAGFGGQAGRQVHLAAGHTVSVRVRPPAGTAAGSAFAILITEQVKSGPLYAAMVTSRGAAAWSIVPAVTAPVRVALPPVRASLTAVLP